MQARYSLFILALCGFLSSNNINSKETFENLFKPIRLNYLYKLFDSHPEMKEELDHMFKIEKVYHLKDTPNKKIISYSLFWKATNLAMPQPVVNKNTIHEKKHGVKKNSTFYATYVHPLLNQLKVYKKDFPDWTARLYLANDLQFLLPLFLDLEVEIFVMASSSVRASPGAMWRFLALDDPQANVVYVRDADEDNFCSEVLEWVNTPGTIGFFRLRDVRLLSSKVPPIKDYSPILAGCFGTKNVHWVDMEKAMKGFILHRMLFPDEIRHSIDLSYRDHPYGFGNRFPDYGFDERFLKHVIYFEAVSREQLTLLSIDKKELRGTKLKLHPWIQLDLKFTKYKAFGPY